MLQIKNETFKKHILIHLEIKINALHVYINNTLLYKFHFPKPISEKVTLFHVFGSLFNVWPNRRQLDSCVCFKIQSVVIAHIM